MKKLIMLSLILTGCALQAGASPTHIKDLDGKEYSPTRPATLLCVHGVEYIVVTGANVNANDGGVAITLAVDLDRNPIVCNY